MPYTIEETRTAFMEWATHRQALSDRENSHRHQAPSPQEWSDSDDHGEALLYQLACVMGWWQGGRPADPGYVAAHLVMPHLDAEAVADRGAGLPPHTIAERARRRSIIRRAARRVLLDIN